MREQLSWILITKTMQLFGHAVTLHRSGIRRVHG